MNKVIRDGKVAVLYSPGYGGGWFSWGLPEKYLFDPTIVAMVEAGQQKDIEAFCNEKYKEQKEKKYLYFGGADQLKIEWIEEGTLFTISEYDGYESIEYAAEAEYIKA